MAGEGNTFVGVVNDTDPKSNGKSFSVTISGSNYNQFLGKNIGDIVDGIFVGDGEKTLSGYKLQITGGSDKTGTPMRVDLDSGTRKKILVSQSVGFRGQKIVNKNGKRYRYKPNGLRKRRVFRGRTVTQDTRQLNLKVVESGNKTLAEMLGPSSEAIED